jgi:Zn finger protein HypA/HybF involved in hydrogenase expression
MKRCKKANVITKKIEVEEYEVQCPHCKTFISGYFGKESLKILCLHCKNPIELSFQKEGDAICQIEN